MLDSFLNLAFINNNHIDMLVFIDDIENIKQWIPAFAGMTTVVVLMLPLWH